MTEKEEIMLHPEHTMSTPARRAPRLVAVAAVLTVAIAAALAGAATLATAATPARAAADYGPDTCLNTFVWRGATAADHVCVTTDVREQVARDNAQAAARRDPAGAWGPDSCLPRYVWREAVQGDRVCVDPRERDQAQRDGAAAASRRNDVRTAIATYNSQRRTCDGDVCTITSDDAPRYRVKADRINVGSARVLLFSTATRTSIRAWRVSVTRHSSVPGGWLSFDTGVLKCLGRAGVTPNAYFRVQDGSSGRWSSRQYVWTGCSTL